MRTIQVQYDQKPPIEEYIIENMDDLNAYKIFNPVYYNIVKHIFVDFINQGQRIIVHKNGSWCMECDDIKILG